MVILSEGCPDCSSPLGGLSSEFRDYTGTINQSSEFPGIIEHGVSQCCVTSNLSSYRPVCCVRVRPLSNLSFASGGTFSRVSPPPRVSLEYMDNLEKLDLSYNQLVSVGPGVFRGLSRLRHLYLHNNRLTVVQQGSLDMLPGLEVHNQLLK